MKISIIGGAGFIGTNLISNLQNSNHQYTVLDKVASNNPLFLQTDVRNPEQLDTRLQPADWVVLLAAEHKDDVEPISLYYDVNVEGTRNVLNAMRKKGINKIIFTSSVAVYGLNKPNPSENNPVDPFNHYGKSKWEAEEVLREWYNEDPTNRTLVIIRPTVVFGPGNKGNVHNLLRQIASGKFMMIGSGENKKSMAYIGNVAGFIAYCITQNLAGYNLFNYADKPDLSTRDLVKQASISLNRKLTPIKIPYAVGYFGGVCLDIIAKITGKKFPISAIRIKKFCATTQFAADKVAATNFKPSYTLEEGLDNTIKSILKDDLKQKA